MKVCTHQSLQEFANEARSKLTYPFALFVLLFLFCQSTCVPHVQMRMCFRILEIHVATTKATQKHTPFSTACQQCYVKTKSRPVEQENNFPNMATNGNWFYHGWISPDYDFQSICSIRISNVNDNVQSSWHSIQILYKRGGTFSTSENVIVVNQFS